MAWLSGLRKVREANRRGVDISGDDDSVSLPPSIASSGDDVSLPPEVESDSEERRQKASDHAFWKPQTEWEQSDADSSVSLPESDRGDDIYDDYGRACGCKQRCWTKFDSLSEELQEWQCHRNMMKDEEVSTVVFQMLAIAKTQGTHHLVLGQSVCKKMFRTLCKIGSTKLNKLKKSVHKGDLAPPRDLRHTRKVECRKARDIAHRFFQGICQSMQAGNLHSI